MQPAKFHFKNIGPVKEAELELGDLTIIAGRNNTGKTYLVYTLYGFLKDWDMLLWDTESDLEEVVTEVTEKGHFKRTIDPETLNQERKEWICDLTQVFSQKGLASVFSSSRDVFAGASIEVELPDEFPKYAQPEMTLPKDALFFLQYDGTDIIITGKYADRQHYPDSYFFSSLSSLYRQFIFPEISCDPFILSAERFGISLFYKELDFTKNQLVDLLQKIGEDKDKDHFSPYAFIDRVSSRYTLPIKDNIDYARDISNIKKYRSALYEDKLFNKIKDMMEGYYRSSSDDIEFISKRKEHSFNIPLHIASSSARGLSDLYFYLRHSAHKNQLVIIDEPESHLDTANQILLARLLARMIQAGLKVLITTHSDYIIKEINNLIMLSRSFKNKRKVVRELGYKDDDFLEPDSIRAYIAEGDGLSKCDIDEFGIDMPVFDETIDKINQISNELASRLEEDGDR